MRARHAPLVLALVAACGTSSGPDGARPTSPRPTVAPTSLVESVLPADADYRRVESVTAAVLGYDYRTLAQARARADAVTTGAFREQYDRTFDDVVRSTATRIHAVVSATAKQVAYVSTSGSTVTWLVFVDQTSTSTSSATPKQTQSVVLLELTDGKASKLTADPRTAAVDPRLAGRVRPAESVLRLLETVGEANVRQRITQIEAATSGAFLAEFSKATPSLLQAATSQHLTSSLASIVTGVVSVSDTSTTLLIATDRVRNGSTEQHSRWLVTTSIFGGRTTVSGLQPVV